MQDTQPQVRPLGRVRHACNALHPGVQLGQQSLEVFM